MIRIRCLGPVRLDAPAAPSPDAVLAQPKRLALLAFMALSDSDALEARDSLLAMFWPDSSETSARTSLRQALRYLRRALGDDVLASRGRDRVGVNRDRVECDAWEFERRLDEGDREGALSLYEGELLQGLELRGSPGFAHWLARERRRIAGRAAAAAWELAEDAREAGHTADALRLARRAREIDRADEEGVRRLMGIQLWAGDRAGALRTYELFERWLAAEYEAVPSLRTRELADRARGGLATGAPTAGLASGPGTSPGDSPGTSSGMAPATSRAGLGRLAERSFRRRSSALRAVPVRGLPGRWTRALAGAAVLLVLLVALAWSSVTQRGGADPAEPAAAELLLVRPFDVRGPARSLDFMRGGMADLFASVFTGELGPRAVGVDSAGTPARWAVTGSVMGDDRQVYLQAELTDLRGLRAPHRGSVSGPADSLYHLARELAERLFALHAGAPAEEAALLARTTPAALRAYLQGHAAYRSNHYDLADRHFTEALRHDSLFAQAAVGLVEAHLAAPWLRGHAFDMALPLAFRLRDRLSAADRQMVTAVAGPNYPRPSTQAEHFQAWERAVVQAPDRAAVWFQWGDALYHVGPFIGLPDARPRARAAFERTLQVDSAFLLPLVHLAELAAGEGRVDLARSYLERLRAGPHDPASVDYLRWRLALATGDETERARVRKRIPEMDVSSLSAIMRVSQFLGRGLEDAEAVADLGLERWTAPAERWTMLFRFHTLALNRGRPQEAARRAEAMRDVAPAPHVAEYHLVRSAIHSGGEPEAAEVAARHLVTTVDRRAPHDAARNPSALADLCVLESWKAHRGDTGTLRASIRWLRDPAMHPDPATERPRLWCAGYLEGILALEREPERLGEAAERLRSMVAEGVEPPGVAAEMLHLVTARVLEATGDIDGALRTVRLRQSVPYALAERLRQEGRLATLAGDTAAALRAYQHYLTLRSDPAPQLSQERRQVEEQLERLTTAR